MRSDCGLLERQVSSSHRPTVRWEPASTLPRPLFGLTPRAPSLNAKGVQHHLNRCFQPGADDVPTRPVICPNSSPQDPSFFVPSVLARTGELSEAGSP